MCGVYTLIQYAYINWKTRAESTHYSIMNFTGGRTFAIVLLVLAVCQRAWTFPRNTSLLSNSTTLIRVSYREKNYIELPIHAGPENITMDNRVETNDAVPLVTGGSLAAEGQFPWMAVIHQLQGDGRIAMCGGTILSVRWILTAAHCVANGPQNFNVILGIVDKSNVKYDFYEGPGVFMRTSQGAVHPQYGEGINDLALLYMPNDITFTDKIQPIKLAGRAEAQDTFADSTGYVFGWGLDGTGNPNDQNYLKYGTLPIISNEQCRQMWNVQDGNICTAAGTGQDACQGDSGGPLVVMVDKQYLQVGIVSYGDANCPSQRAGVYTRVTSYVDWIQQVTGIQY